MTADEHDRLVVELARTVQAGDLVVVGVGTPLALAAVLLARELVLHVEVLMPAAWNPPGRKVADYLGAPWRAAEASQRASRLAILDAIDAGEVQLQFIRPAQVDRRFQVNTELVGTGDRRRHLVGPVALPDIVDRIDRVVAYLPSHDPRTLVPEVTTVTAPRPASPRRVARVITPLATFDLDADGDAMISARSLAVTRNELIAQTGFAVDADNASTRAEPTADELELLHQVIDPEGLARLESPVGRTAALAALAARWNLLLRTEGTSP